MGHWHSQCDRSCLGHRNRRAQVPWSICGHRVHFEHFRCRRGLLARIVCAHPLFSTTSRLTGNSACSFYKGGNSSFVWRFPIAFQILPLIFLLIIVWFFPESPRWLTKVGREEEARYVLGRLRGETGDDLGKAEAEFQDIRNTAELERKTSKNNSYIHMLFGIGTGKLHTGRRVQLVIWLQIMQEWIGIAGVTVYAPTIFGIAGISQANRQWVAGLNNITYMVRY